MANLIDTLLLLALPASGKSEVRTFLASLTEAQCRDDFGLGETVQLDDYPYVHIMRRVDEELRDLGVSGIFFQAHDKPFAEPKDWGTLIELLNEDYADLHTRKVADPASAAQHVFERIDRAAQVATIAPRFGAMPVAQRRALAVALEPECAQLLADKHAAYPETLENKTIVIEFARGGPQGSDYPLPAPFGYGYSLGALSREILSRAAVLYVWVTPEESRRKNEERADPNDPGSILHHGVPIDVMLNDYGCDDMAYLLGQSGEPNTVVAVKGGESFRLRVGRFDNRVDKTSFVRAARQSWAPEDVRALHEGLGGALRALSGD